MPNGKSIPAVGYNLVSALREVPQGMKCQARPKRRLTTKRLLWHCGRHLLYLPHPIVVVDWLYATTFLEVQEVAIQTCYPKLLSLYTPDIIILPSVILTNVSLQREF